MPDTKLTLKNLKDHLRRYGAVYVVLIVVAAVLSNLLWTMTTPRVPENQRIVVYLADSYTDPTPLNAWSEELLEEVQKLDPSILQVDFESLMFADPESDYTGVMVLMARLAAGEGDLFLAGKDAMTALVNSGACMPLEEYYAGGWLNQLEPYYADYTDSETEEVTNFMAGLKLDTLEALLDMKVMYNEGACLAVPVNSDNTDAAMRVAELLVDRLREAKGDA